MAMMSEASLCSVVIVLNYNTQCCTSTRNPYAEEDKLAQPLHLRVFPRKCGLENECCLHVGVIDSPPPVSLQQRLKHRVRASFLNKGTKARSLSVLM